MDAWIESATELFQQDVPTEAISAVLGALSTMALWWSRRALLLPVLRTVAWPATATTAWVRQRRLDREQQRSADLEDRVRTILQACGLTIYQYRCMSCGCYRDPTEWKCSQCRKTSGTS